MVLFHTFNYYWTEKLRSLIPGLILKGFVISGFHYTFLNSCIHFFLSFFLSFFLPSVLSFFFLVLGSWDYGWSSDILARFVKGGHSRNGVFFEVAKKKIKLSWVTGRGLSFLSASDPTENPLQRGQKFNTVLRAVQLRLVLQSLRYPTTGLIAQFDVTDNSKWRRAVLNGQ